MTRLSVRLAQVAVLAVIAAVATGLGVIWIADNMAQARFEASLSPEMLDNLRSGTALSPELVQRIEAFYGGPGMTINTIGALLSGLAVGAVVGWLSARGMMRTFGLLSDTATRIGQGDLGARVGEAAASGISEIDRFTAGFDGMAARIERAETERRESSAAIAHELRTPLTVLTGRLNGMLDGVFPTDQAGLEGLLGQTELLARIVDDLRFLTLAETQQLGLDLADCDLADQARIVVQAQDDTAVGTELAPARVRADPMRLRQAIQALLANALRYGGGSVTVETGTDAGGAFVAVKDRGPGLRAHEAAAAFDRFWRADHSRARDTGGSGLGLSVVQAIARAHGGSASYHDRPGGGAVFVIRLPRDRGAEGLGGSYFGRFR